MKAEWLKIYLYICLRLYLSGLHFLSDFPEPQCDGLFSDTSAFTRIAGVTAKQSVEAVEAESEDEEQSSLAKLLAGLDATVAELISSLKLVQQRKDDQLETLQSTV